MTSGQIKTLRFLKKYNNDILESLKGSNIFLATMVAIKTWESGHGTSPLALNYNNFGGIKGRPAFSSGKTSNGWAIFPSPKESFQSFVYFVSNVKVGSGANLRLRYQKALDAKTPEDQVYWLVYNHYCSSPAGLSDDARAKLYLRNIQSFIDILNDKGIGGKVAPSNLQAYQQTIINTI